MVTCALFARHDIAYYLQVLPVHFADDIQFDYDEIPPGYYYHAMARARSVQGFWHRKKFEMVSRGIPPDARVLDFGCGPGAFLDLLARSHPRVNAVGLDCAASQIEFAKEHVHKHAPDRLVFRRIDTFTPETDFPDGSFDVVTLIEVVEHMHPRYAHRVLREAGRLTKPGGKVIVTSPNYRSWWPLLEICLERLRPFKYRGQHINKLTPNSFAKTLESAGLRLHHLSSFFLFSPFVAPLSTRASALLFDWERTLFPMLGNVLVAEATPIREHR